MASMPSMAHSGPLARHQPLGRMQAAMGHTCPRCGYTGEGVTYFSKGSHIAGLVVLGAISAGMMGLFAIIYYLSQRNNVICPRCAKNWGSTNDLMLSPRSGGALAGPNGHTPLPSGSGAAANGWSIAMFVLAAILMVAGIANFELAPILFGAAFGGGALKLQSVARRQKEARRAALISNLQLPVLSLAAQRQGRLTVTETAAALGWTLPRAEKVLNSLDDGIRVNSEVTDEGVIVYEFMELAHEQGPFPGRRALEG
ncbi:MAG TPA: hypothetical protein VF263_25460 [Longimicrobiaceae bacterium]